VGYSPEVGAALSEERLGAKIAAGDATGLRGATGTPDQIREYLRRFEDAGVDQLIFVMQAGKNRHEHIMESLELFGREVLPEFKERDEAFVTAKTKRLEPIVDAAMARKVDDAPPLPEGYSFPAIPRRVMKGNEAGEQWLEKFADDRASGNRDEALGIIG
jgi:hypothetical protein